MTKPIPVVETILKVVRNARERKINEVIIMPITGTSAAAAAAARRNREAAEKKKKKEAEKPKEKK